LLPLIENLKVFFLQISHSVPLRIAHHHRTSTGFIFTLMGALPLAAASGAACCPTACAHQTPAPQPSFDAKREFV
jgi:hypothetical protein